jgi:hypothetical protein
MLNDELKRETANTDICPNFPAHRIDNDEPNAKKSKTDTLDA